MSINLNDNSYDGGKSVSIFNGGNTGLVENVSMKISKKTSDDKENAPDYKLVFTDSSGAIANTALWYVTKESSYKSLEQLVTAQGKILKHVAKTVLGESFKFPQFNTASEMLDGTMKLIREGLPAAGNFRVFANYGATISPKAYVQPRSWTPFMESMSVAAEDTLLVKQDNDQMERLNADTPSDNSEAVSTAEDAAWD